MLPAKNHGRPPSMIGKTVGNYRLCERIGAGSYASVYTAQEKGNPRTKVAVKCVEKKKLSQAAVENLLVEIRLLKKLHHPHVVEMKDFLWDDQFIYIIMEFCSGGDLATLVKARRGLREPVARRYIQQMAFALRYLRENNVAHMDLKPHNLLLSSLSRSMVKIGDFGLAQNLSVEERKTSLRGSPLYMAPEILFGRPYDAKVDLWSTGVILYEMIYGAAPYSSRTIDEMLDKVRENHPIQFPAVSSHGEVLSRHCLDLLPKLLEKDPGKRMDFVEFFEHPFIDLANAPGPDSLEKGKVVATDAVGFDKAGAVDKAAKAYTDAVGHLQAALMYVTDEGTVRAIRDKIRVYEKRCEVLDKGRTSVRATLGWSTSDFAERLMELARSTPKLEAGLSIGFDAECYEGGQQFEEALGTYENALSVLVPLLKSEPRGERRDLVSKKVHEWLSRAEKLKLLLSGERNEDAKTSVEDPPSPVEHAHHMTWAEMIAKVIPGRSEVSASSGNLAG